MRDRLDFFFVKLFGWFLCIILILTIAFGLARVADSKRAEGIALENLNIEFTSGAESFQRTVSQMRFAMSELAIKFAANNKFEDGTYIEDNVLRADMRAVLVDRRQNEFSKYLSTAFVVDTLKPGYVYELTGTLPSEVFFNQYYVNEVYTNEFWVSSMSSENAFSIFPARTFSTARDTKRVDTTLLPVAYKPQNESRYIIVMMLDMDAMADWFGFSGVISGNNELLYVSDAAASVSKDMLISDRIKTDSEHILRFFDNQNGDIEVFKVITKPELRRAKGNAGFVSVIIFAVFLLVAVAFALITALSYARKAKALVGEMSGNSNIQAKFENGIKNYSQLLEGIRLLTSHDIRTVVESNHKESVLDSLFLQSRMRDVYVGIDDIEENADVTRSFFMMYLRVNYKQEIDKYIGDDSGKATFFLKQLIEMYLETWGVKATTFQIENNGIVSVFDIGENFSGEKDVVESIVSKLSNESEYAFFTVAVSDIYNGIENIKRVYDVLIDISGHTRPVPETQVLYETEVARGGGRFYFSVEEMGKLSALLQNGAVEDVEHKVGEILEYNIKKGINSFELHLLCTEIINCGVKLLNRTLHTLPQSINLSNVYRGLERAYTPEEYNRVCIAFLRDVVEYLRQNKREDDYIISYILDYVDNHYAEDIYLNLFAEKLKLTGAYISSYFKEKMNVNLSDYVNNYRIKKALELSENPQNKNKDIAAMVGLPNINTFIRLFKKYTGYTPGEYRKKHFGDDYKK